jgi:hypothetical protein
MDAIKIYSDWIKTDGEFITNMTSKPYYGISYLKKKQ